MPREPVVYPSAMGRPSLADVRRPQLLDAYAECLVRYGVDDTTLERVAEQAGVTRGLVRHYLGNREDVLRALGERVRDRYLAWLEETVARSASEDRLEAMLDRLLVEQPVELYAVIDALFAEAPKDPQIADVLRDIYTAFDKALQAELAAALPSAPPAARRQVALALLSFGFADTDFDAIGFGRRRRADYRAVAARLIDSLR